MKRSRVLGPFRPFIRILPVLAILAFCLGIQAQSPAEPVRPDPDTATSPTNPDKSPAETTPLSAVPTGPSADQAGSADVLQARIGRARALIAAHRLDTAASELESVRSATRDYAIRNVTSIMLMSVYMEDGNYGRAEALLEENYQSRAAQKDESLGTYFALAGQAVNGARAHFARYRSFGVNPADANLPAEANSDLDRLRSLLERMIAQAKEISSGRRFYDSLSLLEDVLGIRLSLAKDIEDQARWETEYASAREALASSQTQIASLGGIPPLRPGGPANKASAPSPYSTKKVNETPLQIKAPEKKGTSNAQQPTSGAASPPQSSPAPAPNAGDSKPQALGDKNANEPPASDVGSLNAAATKKVVPRYPAMAKATGAAGMVRVHVIVDENGKVVSVSRSEGPVLLRQAAEDAARQWLFQTTPSAGRPVRLRGYVDFSFAL